MLNIVDQIIFNFSNNKSLYIGENLTISEHMIQAAMLAEKNKSSDDLICSSLLHDYGHFVIEDPNQLVNDKVDGKHEIIGANYLKNYFHNKIIEPILLHVEAKKYLSREKKYFNSLSDASKISLKLQGGVMNDLDAKKFENNKNYKNAIKLRKFDEGAKKENIKIKKIEDYKELLNSKVI
ncbi:HD domain-containing protein [Pelagibacteraceae bacterium]|jgi:predicted HD phosphohydrolase|nr:HD domain-containing protein [Candidatus Pelagibacter sp.]MDC1485749.1 HD domain-containing protein [Pelagibacteraceae bacterium]|tara:strand:+ start:136 stop:675 length:540 start_codon:yes stop_codon:yes gene_type:complete